MNKSTPTGEQKLDLAKRINASFDAWCDEMVRQLAARLFTEGFKLVASYA